MKKRSGKILLSAVLLLAFSAGSLQISNNFFAAAEDSSFAPINQYIENTDYSVPSDFWTRKSDVNYGTIKTISYYSTATNSTRNAKVLLPAGYSDSDSTKYPVMYMMHGIGGDENSLLGDSVDVVIGNAIASGVAEKMIVVFPNGCANAEGRCPSGVNFYSEEHYQAYDNFVNDFNDCLMPYINSHFNTATGRENTAISGFSMGGRVALHVGFSLPDKVRYVGAFCPAPGILPCSDMGVAMPGLFSESTFTLPSQYKNDTLVQITAGMNDMVVKDFPESYHNALVANNVPHIWYKTLGGVNNSGGGGHGAEVYKHGLYNFIRRIFHHSSSSGSSSTPSSSSTPGSSSTPSSSSNPSTATGDLEVQMFNGTTSASTNGITPHFKLINTGSSAIDLSNVKLNYYFTEDGTQSQTFWCDWSTVGSSNVIGTFKKIDAAANGADTCLEISFSSGTGTLAPGASIEVQGRFSKSDWSNYDQSDDYSFNSTGSSYADWTKVTAYQNDSLIWGVEP